MPVSIAVIACARTAALEGAVAAARARFVGDSG
jgi:hypothetical protein